MTSLARYRIALVLGLFGLGGTMAVFGAGFWAGRRIPHGLLARLGSNPVPLGAWASHAPAPSAVFESPVTAIDGRMYIFGGFRNAELQASPAVWVYDPTTNTWTRKRDMPSVRTHVNPARLGDALWFAGGFVGNHPGPTTNEVWRYDWRADQWSPGPPLPAPVGAGALVSSGGKLHYFGGYREDRNTDSADHWTFDPSDSLSGPDWVRAAPLPKPRGHLAGAAVNGRIFAIGGCVGHDPHPLDVPWVHRYDPASDTWVEVAPLPLPRSHFEPSTVVRNGRIIILGGRSRPTGQRSLNDVTEYDPIADRWMALPQLPEPRLAPIAVLLGDRILVGLGGRSSSIPDNRTLWLERTDSPWLPGATLPVALGEVSGGVVGDRLFLVGQGEFWTLGLALGTGRWDAVGTHAVRPAPGDHHAAEVWAGRLYLFGGFVGLEGAVQIYDPATETWRLGPAMPFAAGSSASATIGDKIYVAGGIVGDSATRQAARFDPAKETWTLIAPMPRARNHAAAATDGRRLFVFGGRGPGSGNANVVANGFGDVQIYDPVTDTWAASGDGLTAPAALPQARGGMGKAVYAGGEFWVFGGETLDGPGATPRGVYSRVDIYDPVLNRWRSGPPLPTPRHGIFPLLAGDRILVLGGGVRAGHSGSIVAEVLDLRTARLNGM